MTAAKTVRIAERRGAEKALDVVKEGDRAQEYEDENGEGHGELSRE